MPHGLIGADLSGAARASARVAPLPHRGRAIGGIAITMMVSLLIVVPGHASAQTPASGPQTVRAFPHARHERLPCLGCHETGAEHGRLRFERPAGCAACHHKEPTPAKCATCHRSEQYAAPKQVTVTITVPGQQPKPRPVEFQHALHTTKRSCLDCHTTPVTLAPSATTIACKDCHEDHHAAGRSCSTCHKLDDPKAAHRTVEVTHQRCDACHTPTTIALLTPTRSLCSTCHATKATGHHDAKECTTCHFLADPAAFRSKLVTRAPR